MRPGSVPSVSLYAVQGTARATTALFIVLISVVSRNTRPALCTPAVYEIERNMNFRGKLFSFRVSVQKATTKCVSAIAHFVCKNTMTNTHHKLPETKVMN